MDSPVSRRRRAQRGTAAGSTSRTPTFSRYGDDGLDVFSNDAFRNYLIRSVLAIIARVDGAHFDTTDLLPPLEAPGSPDVWTVDTLRTTWGAVLGRAGSRSHPAPARAREAAVAEGGTASETDATPSKPATTTPADTVPDLADVQHRFVRLNSKKVQLDAFPFRELLYAYVVLLRKDLHGPSISRKRDYMLLELRCRYDEMLQRSAAGDTPSRPGTPARPTPTKRSRSASSSAPPFSPVVAREAVSSSRSSRSSSPVLEAVSGAPEVPSRMYSPPRPGVADCLPPTPFSVLVLEAYEASTPRRLGATKLHIPRVTWDDAERWGSQNESSNGGQEVP